MGEGGGVLQEGGPEALSPPSASPHPSPLSGLSNGSPQRRLLYLLRLPCSPWTEEKSISVFADSARSEQMQG